MQTIISRPPPSHHKVSRDSKHSVQQHHHAPLYKVYLYNDGDNFVRYVEKILQKVIKDMTYLEAFEKTREAHLHGQSLIRVYPQHVAEECCEMLRNNNLHSYIESV